MEVNWKSVSLPADAKCREALEVIDRGALRIAIIVSADGHLEGVVTDGDIRRALLNNVSLDAPVGQIMNTNPKVTSTTESVSKRRRLMNAYSILALPIVDLDMRILGLETLKGSSSSPNTSIPVFLMAGGFGTRLKPMTDACPKPMLKIGGKPILEIIMERFIDRGFKEFYVSTHYLADQIVEYFGNGGRWGVQITYVHETEPLGTAGALSLLPDELDVDLMFMINGDVLSKIDIDGMIDFHVEHGADVTLAGRLMENRIPYGVIETDGSAILDIVEKPNHEFYINAGIYVLNRAFRERVKSQGKSDMPTIVKQTVDAGGTVSMFPMHEYWQDIGTMQEFEKARKKFARGF